MGEHTNIKQLTVQAPKQGGNISLSYQCFGQDPATHPVVMINHALTGDANVTGENGWWNALVGPGKVIDTHRFAVVAFNIPGNGVLGSQLDDYEKYNTGDVAQWFKQGLEQLQIDQLYALVGGSVGGCIGWEFMTQFGDCVARFIPIATDWKSTDWLIANCYLQKLILQNSNDPVHDARVHAMLCYRTQASFEKRFGRTINEDAGMFNVETWLRHHGEKLKNRFGLTSYFTVNHFLQSVNCEREGTPLSALFENSKTSFHLVGIDSDMFFTADQIQSTYQTLKAVGVSVEYHEIESIYGHDAFLIEYAQMEKILTPLFT